MTAVLKTPFTELVGVEHPIVQTGMGWVSGPRLTAATANAGGLGILASATMTYEELEAAIKKTKQLTSKPFGVNMRADASDASKRCDLLIREGVKVASFALAPKKDLIAKLKDNGIVVIPSIGAAKHAVKVASWGADAVVVQGGEGGGHTGGVATTLLLPSVLDAVDIPLILYNVPSRTGVSCTAQTYQKLAAHPNIAGVKEASDDFDLIQETLHLCPPDFTLWSGNDSSTTAIMALGGKGVISVDGKMVDAPIVARSAHLLELAELYGFDREAL